MARKDLTPQVDKTYIKSGKWKCDPSPTGAHHWIEEGETFVCRWCHDEKEFPVTFNKAVDNWTQM